MNEFFYWFGVVHSAAYALAGFLVAFWLFVEWLLRRLKLKQKLLRALWEYYKQKDKSRWTGA